MKIPKLTIDGLNDLTDVEVGYNSLRLSNYMATKKRYSSIYAKAEKGIASPGMRNETSSLRATPKNGETPNFRVEESGNLQAAAYDKLNNMIGKSRKSQRRRGAKYQSIDRGLKPWAVHQSRLSPIEFEGSPNLDTIMSVNDKS